MKKIKKFDNFVNEKLSHETMQSYADKIKKSQPQKAAEVEKDIRMRKFKETKELLTGDPDWNEPIRFYIKGENLSRMTPAWAMYNGIKKLGVIEEGGFISMNFDWMEVDDNINITLYKEYKENEYLTFHVSCDVDDNGLITIPLDIFALSDNGEKEYDLSVKFVSRKDITNLLKHIRINITRKELDMLGLELTDVDILGIKTPGLKMDMSRKYWGQ
jgi:hypothetical protein